MEKHGRELFYYSEAGEWDCYWDRGQFIRCHDYYENRSLMRSLVWSPEIGGVRREWNPNGNLDSIISINDQAQWDGLVMFFYYFSESVCCRRYYFKNGMEHGIDRGYSESGELDYEYWWLYGERVSKEEYRKHELILKLSGIGD